MTARAAVDWERIRAEYEAGQLSTRELGRAFGTSEAAIRRRAKSHGWTRSLAPKVRRAVRERLIRDDAVSPEVEAEVVETAAVRGVEVIRSHRRDIGQARDVAGRMLLELDEATANREQIEALIWDETAGDEDGKRRHAMLRAVSLPSRASALQALAGALGRVVALERQAFGLDAPGDEEKADENKAEADAAAIRASLDELARLKAERSTA